MKSKRRVFITTDLNIGHGDPDDMQSLGHLLLYADELEITGIVTDHWGAGGFEETKRVIENIYKDDYQNPAYNFQEMNYPSPEELSEKVMETLEDGANLLVSQAKLAQKDNLPLYVLIWGSMQVVRQALMIAPEISSSLRVLTIATYKRAAQHGGDGILRNWNDTDDYRQYVWDNFKDLWWIESEWTYSGMFAGTVSMSAKDLLNAIANQSNGGVANYLRDCVKGTFRQDKFDAGDTPTVLYLLDPNHDDDDPCTSSWAGRFIKPFPDRENFYTDICGNIQWDYLNPVNTWENSKELFFYSRSSITERYYEMATAFIEKVKKVYGV